MVRYKGFSSRAYAETGTFTLTDVEIVKYDLLNHLFTRKGERVRMPGYGTIIPDLAFEIIDEDVADAVHEEIVRVVKADPRLQMLNLQVIPLYDDNSLYVDLRVQYVELNVSEQINFNIQFAEA